MTASWHFNVDDKGVVHLQARFEGDDGAVKDAQIKAAAQDRGCVDVEG